MALNDLLQISNRRKVGLSEERVMAIVPVARQCIAFWRKYPDIFVDFMCGRYTADQQEQEEEDKSKFSFLFYQRVFLRVTMRYKYTYMVFPRAYSKSFLSVMSLMIKCILYPGAHLFVTSGGKERIACSALS